MTRVVLRSFGPAFFLRHPSVYRLAGAAAAGVLMLGAAADAASPVLVADVNTGRVLYAEDATMPWHPASVTKLMTAYVALKQLRAGAIAMDTPIPVSARANAVPPSKIGVKPGLEVTLENALKMLLVKSANDMAVVIAEGVGGTVENFAEMMNREAAGLGMRESHFVNPNGLFAEGQQTSARDMAILTRALLLQFPERADLFNIGAVQLGNRVMKNTNGLVGRYDGIEGMKTGFICPSGFNLVAVARRNGQRLVTVVFGASSGTERTLKAAQFLDKGFSGSYGGLLGAGGGSLESLPASAVTEAPNMREDICMRRKGAPAAEDEAEAPTSAALPQDGDSGRILPLAASAVSMPGAASPRTLGPRLVLAAQPVFIGRAPGSATAPLAANHGTTPVLAAKVPAEKPKAATAYAGESAATPEALKLKPTARALPLKAGKAAAPAKPAVGKAAVQKPAKPAAAAKVGNTAAKPPVSAVLDKPADPAKALDANAKAAAKPQSVPSKPTAKPNPKADPGAIAKPLAKAAPKAKKPTSTE